MAGTRNADGCRGRRHGIMCGRCPRCGAGMRSASRQSRRSCRSGRFAWQIALPRRFFQKAGARTQSLLRRAARSGIKRPPRRTLDSDAFRFGGRLRGLPVPDDRDGQKSEAPRFGKDIRDAYVPVWCAGVAQLVEHVIRNDGVGGSSPFTGTTFPHCPIRRHGSRFVPETWVTTSCRTGCRLFVVFSAPGRCIPDHSS